MRSSLCSGTIIYVLVLCRKIARDHLISAGNIFPLGVVTWNGRTAAMMLPHLDPSLRESSCWDQPPDSHLQISSTQSQVHTPEPGCFPYQFSYTSRSVPQSGWSLLTEDGDSFWQTWGTQLTFLMSLKYTLDLTPVYDMTEWQWHHDITTRSDFYLNT